MALYCVILVFPVICGFFIKNNIKTDNSSNFYLKMYLCVVFFILFIVAGFRSQTVGIDTKAYINEYILIRDYGINAYSRIGGSADYGYLFLTWVLSRLFYNPHISIIFYSFVIYLGIGTTIYRYSQDVVMSTFLYIMWSFPSSMNTMRQHFACSLVLLFLPYLEKKNYIKYIAVVILAFLFHKSALLFSAFLIIPFLVEKNKTYKAFEISILISLLSCLLLDKIIYIIIKFVPRYYQYFYGYKYGGGTGEISIVWQTIYLIFIIATYSILRRNSKLKYYENSVKQNEQPIIIIIFGLLVVLQFEIAFFRYNVSSIFSRIGVYSRNGLFIIIPYIINNYSKRLSIKLHIIIKLLFYLLFISFGINMIRQDGYRIIPYTTFFS